MGSIKWEFGDGSSASGMTATHHYSTNGTYRVKMVSYSPCGIEDIYQDISVDGTLSIQYTEVNNNFSIYPNPSSNKILINVLSDDVTIRIYSNLGNLFDSFNFHHSSTEIDISQFIDGIYYIEIIDKNGLSEIHKLIKK